MVKFLHERRCIAKLMTTRDPFNEAFLPRPHRMPIVTCSLWLVAPGGIKGKNNGSVLSEKFGIFV